jgi:hypothetical protein
MQLMKMRLLTEVKTTVQYSTFLRGAGEAGCGFPILDILLLRLSSLLLNPAIEPSVITTTFYLATLIQVFSIRIRLQRKPASRIRFHIRLFLFQNKKINQTKIPFQIFCPLKTCSGVD